MIAVDTEGWDPELKTKGPGWHRDDTYTAGVAIGTELGGFRRYYNIEHPDTENRVDRDKLFAWLNHELRRTDQPKVGAHLLYDIGYLGEYGVEFKGPLYDVQVAEPLLDENAFNYSLERLSKKYLGIGKLDDELEAYIKATFGKEARSNPKRFIAKCPSTVVAPYAIGDVNHPLEIFKAQKPLLEAEQLWDLFIMESKLIPLLHKMRKRAVAVDIDKADAMRSRLRLEQSEARRKMRSIVGFDVEVWAAKSLAQAYDQLGVQYPRTPKTGAPSFTKPSMERLAAMGGTAGEFTKAVLEDRRLDKMCGTFLEGCILDAHHNGRIYCNFNQLKSDDGGTVSGRFSCVAGWTPINTKRGLVPIRDIQIGDEVWTHKERWRKVTHTWIKGHEQMLDVYLSNGEVLTCTRKHRLLDANGQWVTAGTLHERFKELDVQSIEHQEGVALVPASGYADAEDSQDAWDYLAQCQGCAGHPHAQGRKEGLGISAPLALEDARPKRDAGQIWQEAPQLEGTLHRQERLHHVQASRPEATADTQPHHLQDIWYQETAPRLGSPSHRRRRIQLRQAQFGNRDQERTQGNPLVTEDRAGVVEITAIKINRPYEVYDITVEEDESYASLGCLSHNSSLPNLQFIPERTAEGKLIRSIFQPDPGCRWAKPDYSQIEFRLMVHDAVEMGLRGARAIADEFINDPTTDFHEVVAEIVFGGDFTDTHRKRGKTINFGIAFGEGKDKLASQLGVPLDEAMQIIAMYHRKLPFMEGLADGASRLAAKTGEIVTLYGRKRRFPWGKAKWDRETGERSVTILPHRVPGATRVFTHKALNARIQGSAADIMKDAMVKLDADGIFDVLGVPHLTVHDELDFSYPSTRIGVQAMEHVKHVMETVVRLEVPLKVDIASGPNWGEASDEDWARELARFNVRRAA